MTPALTSPVPRKARGCYKRSKLIHGVGTNDADYPTCINTKINGRLVTLWRCPYYNTWAGMLERCYSNKSHVRNPAYIGCSVAKEWQTFSVFRVWMAAQMWEGNQLDKDLLIPGNRVYSHVACRFIDRVVNTFILDNQTSRGAYPTGVCWTKANRKFAAQCNNPFTGKRGHIGYFDCPNEAHLAWATRKLEHAKVLAAKQTDPRVAKALIDRFTAKYEAALDTLTAGA